MGGDIPWSMVENCPNLYSMHVVGKLEFLPAQLVLLQNLTLLLLQGQDIIMDKIIETLEKLPCLRVLYIFNQVVSRIHGAQPLVSFAKSFPHLESLQSGGWRKEPCPDSGSCILVVAQI
ncbi:hypothetical protein DVH24_005231 [Malus domestica]|uniref:FBD domain-containing protein n=1 Tax=Malus domestica TaxID=3750 RepID=A0A498IH36_MALDO|nr:hypothetical protein DVH24_005231 [Malus domestica]